MSPILNVEYHEAKVVQEVNDLSSGLRNALEKLQVHSAHEDYERLVVLLNSLSVESMHQLRKELPGLRVTAHYLTLADSRILDLS